MIVGTPQDWNELSRLYEHADELSEGDLAEWLLGLQESGNKFVDDLKQMLQAKDAIRSSSFLEDQPALTEAPGTSGLWKEGSRLGPYRLERIIGKGGMSDVWLASRADGAFERLVAIKLLADHPIRSQREAFGERFKREKDILASLAHPNIATLQDAGLTIEGYPWLALEFIDGDSITNVCDRQRATLEERVRLFLQILLAVEFAHAALVIHRDIKPSNVLVGIDGQVKLLDFGIAKLIESSGALLADTALTQEGGRLMTPQYASPEQFCGQPLTTATDVYSLGMVLYELLSGEFPYQLAGKPAHVMEAIVTAETPRLLSRAPVSRDTLDLRGLTPRQWVAAVRPDLDAIVAKALERLPERRYRSAGELRLDLQRWLAFEPVLATRATFIYRTRRFLRRNQRAVGAGVLVGGAIVTATTLAYYKEVKAQKEATTALASKRFLLDMFRQSDPTTANTGNASAGELLDASVQRAMRDLGGQPELKAEVLRNIAEIDGRLDRYVPAHAALEEVVGLYQTLGRKNEEFSARVDLAENDFRMGDYARALAELGRVDVGTQAFAKDLALQAHYHLVKGWVVLNEGHAEEARSELRESLTPARTAFGEFDTRTAWAYRALSEADSSLRDFDAAREHILTAQQSIARAKDATNADVIGIEIERALTELKAGAYGTALPLVLATAAHCDRVFGSANENCFLIRIQQYQLEIKTGDERSALAVLAALRAEARNALSPRRQVEAQFGVVRILAANRMWNEANEASDDLKGMLDRANALPGYVIVAAYQAIAESQVRQGRGRAAQETLDGVASKLLNLPVAPAYVARSLMIRAIALAIDGDVRSGLQAIHAAEAAYSDAFGASHTQTVLCGLNETNMLIADHDYVQARALLVRSMTLLALKLPPGSPLMLQLGALSNALLGYHGGELARPSFFN